ncbi:MAG TPA: universal stress protein [Saprospiraceae bacterium]|nr:universal stress protein [Saprospiraceae bacterium]HMQ82916.1 universal stress protein [Saprospiraceae bacterium]
MKSILVPTDFSDFATLAADAAAELARRFEAKLFFFHCLENSPSDTAPEVDQVADTLNAYRGKYPEIDIQTGYASGTVAATIAQYAAEHAIDFLVMGSHGRSGKSEYFIGSVTQKVIRQVHCPVLVVKEPLTDWSFDKVVFASSFHENEVAAFLHFKDFVKHFAPEIHLVEIQTGSLFDPPYFLSKESMERFRHLASPFYCRTHVLQDWNVDHGIRSFAEKIGAKLIGISNHHRHPLKRMLVGSRAEALINHAGLPVITIDYLDE